MMTQNDLMPVIKKVQEQTSLQPKVGIILGSGLGPLANEIEQAVHFPYPSLPGMPQTSVQGHDGELVVGHISGTTVACLKGRVHYYEGASSENFKRFVRVLKLLGCTHLLITNAAGSLRQSIDQGEFVLVNDHINFQFQNPLIGPNDDEFGPRFFPMDEVYDKTMREQFHATAESLGFQTHEGVYFSVLGPNFETPAEIRAYRTLGADVVGMSTVPEVLVAKHCGLKVCLVSTITNLSADLHPEPITHDTTMTQGQKASAKLCKLVKTYFAQYGQSL